MTRDELRAMIDLAGRLLAAQEPAVLSTLFFSEGSTYRPLGSMMVSGPGSLLAGGISGGCLEEYVARAGRLLTHQKPAATLCFHSEVQEDGRPALGCGGSIEILVERLTAEQLRFLERFSLASGEDLASTTACILDESDPRSPMVERSWSADRSLQHLHHRSLHHERSYGGRIDSSRRALVQFIPPMRRLIIFGAGNDAQPLCAVAHSLGWHVTVADRRGRLATEARFPDAANVLAAPWNEAIDQMRFTPHTAVVLVTHSVADDIEILSELGERPMVYLGALGPEHRRQWLVDGIRNAIGSSDIAAMLRGPIGLNLGDRSPAGIAVSIMAEILSVINEREPAPLSRIADVDTPVCFSTPVFDE